MDYASDHKELIIKYIVHEKNKGKGASINTGIYEVGISYYGRTYEEGKKINWKDGVRAIYCIIKHNLLRR